MLVLGEPLEEVHVPEADGVDVGERDASVFERAVDRLP